MLIKRIITNKDFQFTTEVFPIESVMVDVENNKVKIKIKGAHDFTKSGKLILSRELDDRGVFSNTFKVTSCETSWADNTTIVEIEYFNIEKYYLTPYSYVKDKEYCLEDGTSFVGTELYFKINRHICIQDRGNVVIDKDLFCGDKFEDLGPDFCGCNILYDNKILYSYINNESKIRNITTHKLFYDNKEYDTVVPFSHEGYDNRQFMLILDDIDIDMSKGLFVEDCRFFDKKREKGKSIEWFAQPNTVVKTIKNTLNLEVSLGSDFNNNLLHDQLFNDYIDEIKDSYVVKPLDYEKVMFTPVYYNKKQCFDLNSLSFNIFLRKRHFFEESMEWRLASLSSSTSGDTWVEDNDTYWNSYKFIKNAPFPLYSGKTLTTGDLLGDLGFDDNDVLNQNKRLGKTFIRLLFFDSTDRATQTLLYYSTIFINTTKLYSKYINNITSDVKLNKSIKGYVFNPNEEENLILSCNFTCFNKYNMSGSSEGYYLYLFPVLIEEDKAEDREIYMRVEFNHAKYGQTIPLVCALEPKNNYTKVNEHGKQYTDMPTLYNDMYIPVKIKYCSLKKAYVWYFNETYINDMFKDNFDKNNPTFNLWEPKIR